MSCRERAGLNGLLEWEMNIKAKRFFSLLQNAYEILIVPNSFLKRSNTGKT